MLRAQAAKQKTDCIILALYRLIYLLYTILCLLILYHFL